MMRRHRRPPRQDAELDITAFMNLMIVLVPVLLLGMVFARITVVDVTLPLGALEASDSESPPGLELLIRAQGLQLDYPQGVLLRRIPLTEEGAQDFDLLSLVLQEVKRQLVEAGADTESITLLPEPAVDYQTIVAVMDRVRSFETVVAASVVDAELFPAIAFGDAPVPEAEATP